MALHFQAYRDNEIEYDPKSPSRSPQTDNVVIPDSDLTDEEMAEFWENE